MLARGNSRPTNTPRPTEIKVTQVSNLNPPDTLAVPERTTIPPLPLAVLLTFSSVSSLSLAAFSLRPMRSILVSTVSTASRASCTKHQQVSMQALTHRQTPSSSNTLLHISSTLQTPLAPSNRPLASSRVSQVPSSTLQSHSSIPRHNPTANPETQKCRNTEMQMDRIGEREDGNLREEARSQ
jgi:hypothetical protein